MISIVTFTLAMISTMWCPVMVAPSRRAEPFYYAFMYNISECLLDEWKKNVLERPVYCPDLELCYNAKSKSPAQFAVCFDRENCIPHFTAHKLAGKGNPPKDCNTCKRGNWHTENVEIELEEAPLSEFCSCSDYGRQHQNRLVFSWPPPNERFVVRGHLTPCADFSTCDERKMTMINTNAAPQWQAFNNGNWRRVEDALREYAKTKNPLYVFTGTEGSWEYTSDSTPVNLNGRLRVPLYFWKVVCDPILEESLAIIGKNDLNGHLDKQDVPSYWDTSVHQKKSKGIIKLYSVNSWGFNFLPLRQECRPNDLGEHLKAEIGKQLNQSLRKPSRKRPAPCQTGCPGKKPNRG